MSEYKPESIASLMKRDLPEVPSWIEPAILPKRGKLLFGGHAKVGKAQDPDEPVLTIDGWKTIGNLTIGEPLISIDGRESIVTGVYNHSKKELLKVVFSDGRSTIVAEDHLWEIDYYDWSQSRVYDTSTIQKMLEVQRFKNHLYIPRINGEWGKDEDLTIDPWVLGVLIGDGGFTGGNVMFTTADDFIEKEMKRILDCEILPADKFGWRISDNGFLKMLLKDLGIWGKMSPEKFVPEVYKKGSKETRKRILQGLIDTDGTVDKKGFVTFYTSSPVLAKDVVYLARSLGATASISEKKPPRNSEYGPSYRLGISGTEKLNFVSLPRKKERLQETIKESRLTIESIKRIRTGDAVCISVSHPSSLYVTRDFIVTHNSFVALETARALATGTVPFSGGPMNVVTPVKVLLVEQELGSYGLQKRAKVCYDKENLERLDENLWYVSKVPKLKLNTQEGRMLLQGFIEDVQPQVVVLDPIGKMHAYEENNNTEIARLFNYLDGIIETYKSLDLSLVISHHFGKPSHDPNDTSDPLSPYNFRGASKWFDDPDTLITVSRMANMSTPHKAWYIKMRTITRQGEELPDMLLTVNKNQDLRVLFEKSMDEDDSPGFKEL